MLRIIVLRYVLTRMSRMSGVWRYYISEGIPRRSLGIAFVAGTVLNLINQGDAIFIGKDLHFTEIILNYAVLFCVAIYGAVSYRFGRGE
jgi:hypothetical protein